MRACLGMAFVVLALVGCGGGDSPTVATQTGSTTVALTPSEHGTRPATAEERQDIAAVLSSVHQYEANNYRYGPLYSRSGNVRFARLAHLHPEVIRARVSLTEPPFAAAVALLRDDSGRPQGDATVNLLQKTSAGYARQYAEVDHNPWEPIAQTGTRFVAACGSGTPLGIRDLVCPDPWRNLKYPSPGRDLDMTIQAPGPVSDVHHVNWRRVTFPGAACRAGSPISSPPISSRPRGVGGNDSLDEPWWGRIDGGQGGPVAYGDMDGDGRDEVVLLTECTNTGGTADGQLFFGADVVGVRDGSLKLLGVITPRQPLTTGITHVPLINVHADGIRQGHVSVQERWYGPCDGTAAGSGEATTVWRYARGRLIPRTTVLRLPSKHPCDFGAAFRNPPNILPGWLRGINHLLHRL